jgi:putative hemolysin
MEILIIALLILLNGVFSMSEISLVSSRKFKLEVAAKNGDTGARKALVLAENPNTFLSTVQIGITLIGILTGIYSGEKITDDLERLVGSVTPLQPYAHSISVGLVVIILTYFSIVFGELLPKRIGLAFPEKVASVVSRPMELVSKVTSPFIWLLAKTNDFMLRILGIREGGDGAVSEAEITSIIQESTLHGEIDEIEHDIVKRVFALGDRKVSELMTHRTDLVWLNISDDLQTVKSKIANDIHSAYPVRNKESDKLIGLVYLKEMFIKDFSQDDFNLADHMRKPLYIHENSPAYNVLGQFKSTKMHHAIIVDEYGAVEGMLAMDDIVDALVGDQPDHSQDDYEIVKRDENSWLADGQYSYYEFLNYFKVEDNTGGSFTTLGGLILNELQHIPTAGEKIEWNNFQLEVIDMDDQRIDKVLITRKGKEG